VEIIYIRAICQPVSQSINQSIKCCLNRTAAIFLLNVETIWMRLNWSNGSSKKC